MLCFDVLYYRLSVHVLVAQNFDENPSVSYAAATQLAAFRHLHPGVPNPVTRSFWRYVWTCGDGKNWLFTVTRCETHQVQTFITRGPLYWHGLILIPAWVSDYIHYKVRVEVTYSFPNLNGAIVEVWEYMNYFIPHFTGHVITYPCWD